MTIIKKIITITATIILALITFILFIFLVNYSFTMNDFNTSYKDNPYFHTIDTFDDNFSEIRNRQSINDDLIRVNTLLHNATHFDFVEAKLGVSYVEKKTYKGDEQFAYSSDDFNYSDDLNQIKSCFLSYDFISEFDILMNLDEKLKEKDYVATIGESSVILGYDYINIYKINERINIIHYGIETIGTIKGFLKPNSKLVYFNQEISLDDKIVLPLAEIIENPQDATEKEYNFKLLLEKNNGIVRPKTTLAQAKQEIEAISKEYNLPYASSISYKKLKSIYDTLNTVLVVAFSFSLFFLIFFILRLIKILKPTLDTANSNV